MVQRRDKPLALKIRLYPGQDDDLLAWLGQFEDRPYGAQTQALKAALRRGGLGADGPAPPALDLAEVRRVVEAAVASALRRWSPETQAGDDPEDDETEELLDALGAALVMDGSDVDDDA